MVNEVGSQASGQGLRRQSRAYALHLLYALDGAYGRDARVGAVDPDDGDADLRYADEFANRDGEPLSDESNRAVNAAVTTFSGTFELDVDPAAHAFAGELIDAARKHADRVDSVITAASRNWRLERMSRVDRNILRLGTCELIQFPDVPVNVVINEAVELAKRFGAGESAAFVNGILDRIAHSLGRASTTTAAR